MANEGSPSFEFERVNGRSSLYRTRGILGDPCQITGQAGCNWDCNDFRKFIGMQLEHGLFQRRIEVALRLDEEQLFFGGFVRALPGEKGFYPGQDIDAGGEFALQQCPRNPLRARRVGTGTQYNAMIAGHGRGDCSKAAAGCRSADSP